MHGSSDTKRERKRARDRRYYQRELDGKAVADVEYDGATLDWLERYDWDRPGETIGDAISRMLRASVEYDAK